MTIPAPWNDKNKCFIYTKTGISDILSDEQKEQMVSVNTTYTTYIRSNLALTDGADACIPNAFEAIATTYDLLRTTTLQMNAINTQLSTLSNAIETINSEIETIKEQIEELKPQQ